MAVLFQQPAAVQRPEAALTARFLRPVLPALEALLLEIRAETDLALGRDAARYGKPYPIGYCAEITHDVLARLGARLRQPRHAGERALKAFIHAGGDGRRVWGVLRGQYFQNALQIGGLYIDVANDTVDVRKPKIEILPMQESGFEAIRDAAHFAAIAEAYWGLRIVANHAVPSLAPLLPMIGVPAAGPAHLQSNTQYMVELFRQDGFARSQTWLAEGPAPSAEVIEAVRALCPASLLAAAGAPGQAAAIEACRSARAAGRASDPVWRDALVADFPAVCGSIPVPERG